MNGEISYMLSPILYPEVSLRRSRGYAPFYRSVQQDGILDSIIDRARSFGEGSVGVFDLDGCLFDTRPRIIHLLRELAAREHLPELYAIAPQHFLDWDLGRTMTQAGIAPDRIEAILPKAKAHFFQHFFLGEYVLYDHAMPGATRLVQACYEAGMHVVYLTGRHEEMRAGTETALTRWGFPLNCPRANLIVKPDFHTDDTEYKEEALRTIAGWGTPQVFLDNEPSNVNAFREKCPDALVVFLETDHSPKPVEPHKDIPWVRGFSRTSDPA